MPPSPARAFSQITIQNPDANAPLEPGIVHVTGTFSGVYDIALAVNGELWVEARMEDPDADGTGTWSTDVDLTSYDGPVEIIARGVDSVTRYAAWSPFLNLEVNNPAANTPVVRINSPSEQETWYGVVPVKVEVSAKNDIAAVEVRINGGAWQEAGPSDGTYTFIWDTKPYGGRICSLEARARDVNGNTGFSRSLYARVVKKPGVTPESGMTSEEIPAQDLTDSMSANTEQGMDIKTDLQESNNQGRAIWIWENESYPLVLNPGSRTVLDAMASDTETFGQDLIKTFYLAVGRYNGIRMLEDKRPEVRDFIDWAHKRGYRVQALIAGGTMPPYFGAYSRYETQALSEFEQILNYNLSSKPKERFDAVNIDTEPYSLPDFKSGKPSVQVQYLDMLKKLMERKQASGLTLQVGAAIPRWYDSSIDASEIPWNGTVKWLSQHIQDTVDYISIMDYRDQAEGGAGIIQQALGEMEYANTIGKPHSVLIGVETKDIADGGDPETITFNDEGRLYMEAELDKVSEAFAGNTAFGGIALHHYTTVRSLPSKWGPGAVRWFPGNDVDAPSSVTGTPQAEAIDYQRIDVSYGPASDNASIEEYHIYRGLEGSFAADATHLAGISQNLKFRDTGLLPGTTYVYKITAVDTSGNEGPPSDPIEAATQYTDLKPMVVTQMQLGYGEGKATVTLQIADLDSGEGIAAAVSGRFTHMAGKYVNGSATSAGSYSASSEAIATLSGEIGFLPRRITAPGYYWAQAYDAVHAPSVRWGD
ncbi:Ig-like domain-containing protein [Paenibacillus sp. SAF-054]